VTRHSNGLRGVFLVAAELSRVGFSVADTAQNASGADLLVFATGSAQARSIEVKTNSSGLSYWLVGKNAKRQVSRSHFYVFLNIGWIKDGGEVFEYFVVPSTVVSRKMVVERGKRSTWRSFDRKSAEPYRDRWALLGLTKR